MSVLQPSRSKLVKVNKYACLLGYAILSIYVFDGYLQLASLPFVLGILAFSFTVQKGTQSAFPYRYAVISLLWLLACFVIPVKTLLFFSAGFALLFLVETWFGKAGFLSVITLALIAPAFQYAANVFSFPIRLQLTQWAGTLFKLVLDDVTTRGNVIFYRGNEFSVDPACMGLNMLVASLLLGVIFIGFYQKKAGKILSSYWVFIYLASVVLLNIMSNLIRILLLVLFNLLPGNWMHDAAGLICLVVYVLLPASFLAKLFIQYLAKDPQYRPSTNHAGKWKMIMQVMLLGVLSFATFRVNEADTYEVYQLNTDNVNDYSASLFAPGIVKLENRDALIYVKYVRGFYDSDHNPMLCWKGSGYELQQVRIDSINGHQLFTAWLVNGKEKLYTAWWYGDHQKIITSQLEWRWDMIRENKRYAVINVTAATQNELHAEVSKILQQGKLAALFNNGV